MIGGNAVGYNFRMKVFSITFCLLFVFILLPSYAHEVRVLTEKYVVDNWTTENGLPQNSVKHIFQTKDGYIWLCTFNGLVRFDGVNFKVFNSINTDYLISNRLVAFIEDREGGRWIATEESGVIYLPPKGKSRILTIRDGLQDNKIDSVFEDSKGRVWIMNSKGLCYFQNGSIRKFSLPKQYSDLHLMEVREVSRGEYWFITSRYYLLRLKDGKFSLFRQSADGFFKNCYSIIKDSEGTVWFGGEGVFFSYSKGRFKSYEFPDKNGFIWNILEDSRTNLWLAATTGLYRFNREGFIFYKITPHMDFRAFTSIYEDLEGNLWLGSNGIGLLRIKERRFLTYSTAEGLPHDVIISVSQDSSGGVWAGTLLGGIAYIKDNRVKVFPQISRKDLRYAKSVLPDNKGSVWIGTDGGLVRLTGERIRVFGVSDGLVSSNIFALYEDREKNLWIGTDSGGLLLYRDGKFMSYGTDVLAPNAVISILKDSKGRLWVGTNGGGLYSYNDGIFTNHELAHGAASKSVRALYEDKEGNIWIGTYGGGLHCYKDGKIHSITTRNGLFSNVVSVILPDDEDHLWMSCNKGVFSVFRNELIDFFEGRKKKIDLVSYGAADGMISSECNGGSQPSGWRDNKGRLWFPTIKGLVAIDPSNRKEINLVPPPVVVERAIIDGKDTDLNGKLEFPAGVRNIEIHYTALSFMIPEKVRFKYILKGFNKDWVDVGQRRVAYFTNIPPGDYSFQVVACNNDGIWNTEGTSLFFRLRPYFHQTAWFYLLAVLIVALAGFTAYKLRIRSLQHRQEELETLVRERTHQLKEINEKLEESNKVLDSKVKQRTEELEKSNEQLVHAARIKSEFLSNVSHELRTPLASILGYAELLQRSDLSLNKTKRAKYLEILSGQAERLLQHVKSLLDVNAMESGTIDLDFSPLNINDLIKIEVNNARSRLRFSDKEISFNLDDNIGEFYFDYDKITQILKNLIENAVKFSPGKKRILIESQIKANEIQVSVSDKGIGIPSNKQAYIFDPFYQIDASSTRAFGGTGLGLYIAKSFVELHNGRIWVRSQINKGATFTVCLPTDIEAAPEMKDSITKKGVHVSKAVLVADDNVDIVELVKLVLQDEYKVYTAHDGKEAVTKSLEINPCLILMDLAMPVLDGYQATKIIKNHEETKNVPVIALSARTKPDEVKRALQAGCSEHISKPFSLEQINEIVSRYCSIS